MNLVCKNNDSELLLNFLYNTKEHIIWAQSAVDIFKLITDIHNCHESSPADEILIELNSKVTRLQTYLHIDLLCHITAPVARVPFSFKPLRNVLEKLSHALQSNTAAKNGTKNEEEPSRSRIISDCISDLNLIFSEYGFITSADDDVQDNDDKAKKFQAMKRRLREIENSYETKHPYDSAEDLRDLVRQWGWMVDHPSANLPVNSSADFEEIREEINEIKSLLLKNILKSGTPTILSYMAMFHLFKKDFVSKIYRAEQSSLLRLKMIHPMTRGWLLERVRRWLLKPRTPEKRLYYLMGKQGFGRTSLSAAVCKIHSTDLAAYHFFDSTLQGKPALHNSLIGLIQSISSGLMQTMPEYLNYMDDKLSGLSDLQTKLNSKWEESYSILLKDPLEAVCPKNSSEQSNGKSHRRKLIVIDSLEECSMTDWKSVYAFLLKFLKDTSHIFCLFVTARSKKSSALLPSLDLEWEGIRLDDKAWIGSHISDLERYMAHSIGTIISRGSPADDEEAQNVGKQGGRAGAPRLEKGQPALTGMSPTSANHGRLDQKTMEQTVDEFVKMTAGRFDWALELIEMFSKEMNASGQQFIGSVKRVNGQMRDSHGGGGPPLSPGGPQNRGTPSSCTEKSFIERTTEFCGSFRAYRDKTGRSEGVKVTSPRQHLQNTSRLPLLVNRLELQ